MNIRPLHDRVVIKRLEEVKSEGGILIPGSAAEKPVRGTVVAIGNGKMLTDGKIVPLAVKAGDTVVFGKYSGTEIKLEGQELIVMREEDIMGIIEK